VVYGTGYYYPPWIGTDWYGFPCTYGFGAGVRWTPWTGWGFGFGLGWGWGLGLAWGGWGWGLHPWWGGFPGRGFGGRFRGFAGTSGDAYARFDRSRLEGRMPSRVEAFRGFRGARPGIAYNSHTGMVERGDRGTVQNIYANRANRPAVNGGPTQHAQLGGRFGGPSAGQRVGAGAVQRGGAGAAQRVGPGAGQRGGPGVPQHAGPAAGLGRPATQVGGPARGGNNVFASPRGQVFVGSPSAGFQQRVGAGWQPAGAASNGMLNHASGARALGAQRTEGFRAMGGFHGGGGGFHGGGGGGGVRGGFGGGGFHGGGGGGGGFHGGGGGGFHGGGGGRP
jgi:hypothetical protein